MTLISVLSKAGAKEFDEPPIFNSIDRKHFYNLNTTFTDKIVLYALTAYIKTDYALINQSR
jgi:hypothetical protein